MSKTHVDIDHVKLEYPEISLMLVSHTGKHYIPTQSHAVLIKSALKDGASASGFALPGTIQQVIERKKIAGDHSLATKDDFDKFIKENPQAALVLIAIGERDTSEQNTAFKQLRLLDIPKIRELVKGYFSQAGVSFDSATPNQTLKIMQAHEKDFVDALTGSDYVRDKPPAPGKTRGEAPKLSKELATGLHAVLAHSIYGSLNETLTPKGHYSLVCGLDDVVRGHGLGKATIITGEGESSMTETALGHIGIKRDQARINRNAAVRVAYETFEAAGIADEFFNDKLPNTGIPAQTRGTTEDLRGTMGLRHRVKPGASQENAPATHFSIELSDAQFTRILEMRGARDSGTKVKQPDFNYTKGEDFHTLLRDTQFVNNRKIGRSDTQTTLIGDTYSTQFSMTPRQSLGVWEEVIKQACRNADYSYDTKSRTSRGRGKIEAVAKTVIDLALEVVSEKKDKPDTPPANGKVVEKQTIDFDFLLKESGLSAAAVDKACGVPSGTFEKISASIKDYQLNPAKLEAWKQGYKKPNVPAVEPDYLREGLMAARQEAAQGGLYL